MASNGAWGEAQTTPTQAEVFEKFEKYDELTHTPALQKWLDSKGLEFNDLQRLGVRQQVAGPEITLVYQFPEGLKFRTLSTNKRWTDSGTQWNLGKRVRSSIPESKQAIVVEGETDGALMSRLMNTFDVYIMPAGALHVSTGLINQLKSYESVYVALDNDEAGKKGTELFLRSLTNASKLSPPDGAKDWCEAAVTGKLSGWVPKPEKLKVTFSFAEIVATDFGSFEENNWFEDAILPVGGQMMIHAPKKSLKSFILLDLVKAIAAGEPFAGSYKFVRKEGPGKVLLIQMEIPPMFFQLRIISWLKTLSPAVQALFMQNAYGLGIADRKLPRLSTRSPTFRAEVFRAIEESGAEVICFDPIQRLTGDANLDKTNEMDVLLDFFAELQQEGLTVIACHHNSKASGGNSKDPNAMVGTQRFSGDADSICSVWHDPTTMVGDDNPGAIKERNFTWTLRNGSAAGRSIRTRPNNVDKYLVEVEFDELITVASTAPPGAPAL